ncbi:hypothetical protein CKO29_14530 [Allochromatium vinosum]|nr:hypothetical protein [Allochromatium vinosum]
MVDFFIAPSSQRLEPPRNPERFTPCRRSCHHQSMHWPGSPGQPREPAQAEYLLVRARCCCQE